MDYYGKCPQKHKKFKKMFANKKKLLTFASPFEGNTLES